MARQFSFIICLFSILWAGCSSYEEPETPIDAGRQFISAIYNGNFKRAGQLIVPDDATRNLLKDSIEQDFRSRDGFAKEALSKSSIRIDNIKAQDSLTTTLEFTNAYFNAKSILVIKKADGLWKIGIQKWK